MSKTPHVPSYRLHKSTGQAIVTLPDGQGGRHDVYLGIFGTPQSKTEYDRVVAEWIASGRQVHQAVASTGLSVNELLVHYWRFVEGYYRHADGQPTSEQSAIKLVLRRLRSLYGHTEATAFNSLALETLRNQ